MLTVESNRIILNNITFEFGPDEATEAFSKMLYLDKMLSKLFPTFEDKLNLLKEIISHTATPDKYLEQIYRTYPKKHRELRVYSNMESVPEKTDLVIFYKDFKDIVEKKEGGGEIICTSLPSTLINAQGIFTNIYFDDKLIYPNENIKHTDNLYELVMNDVKISESK